MNENTNTERDRAIMEGERNASLDAYSRVVLLTSAESRLYEAAFTNGWDRCAAHVQKPAEIEHVAGDVSKHGAELDTSQQPAPAYETGWKDGYKHGAWSTQQPAPTTQQAGERVYAFRRKGLDDFCTCDEARYGELWNKPHLFETRIFYTAPQSPTTQADSAPAAICNACGADLLEVKQSPNSYLSAEQFDADKLGDWYCKCCPKGPSEGGSAHRYFWNRDLGAAAPQADSQPAPVLDYPPLPRVGAIGYASVVDIESYAKTLTIGPHLPGVRDIALWTTDQMRAYADETYALRIGAKHA